VKPFEDSDHEDDDDDHAKDAGVAAKRSRIRKEAAEDSDEDDQVVDDSHKEKSLGTSSSKTVIYEDDELDLPLYSECDAEHEALFPSQWGWGSPVFSGFAVISALAQHVPMYFVQVKQYKFPWQNKNHMKTNNTRFHVLCACAGMFPCLTEVQK